QKMFTAKNPPFGAMLSYYLKDVVPPETPKKDKDEMDKKDAAEEKPKTETKGDAAEKKEGKAKITVLDKDGKVLREMDGPGAAGVNRTNWDLRSNSPAEPTPNNSKPSPRDMASAPAARSSSPANTQSRSRQETRKPRKK